MAKIDDVRAALAAELEAQNAEPGNPVIAAAVADLESELAGLEFAERAADKLAAEMDEKPAAPPADPPPAPEAESPPPEAPPAAPVAPPAAEAPTYPAVDYSEPTAIPQTPADHPSRLPPAARPHGFVHGNVHA